MERLLTEIKKCSVCLPFLADGINPILSASPKSKIAIIGQAPGRIVHNTSVPWDDRSGERLRDWMGVSDEEFYNPELFAIVPMGFCYPGKGKTGDLPPRKECAPLWHNRLFDYMPDLDIILLIGQYAQHYYLEDNKKNTLTETVKSFEEYLPRFLPLPHPSPRNNIWLRKNPWFQKENLNYLKTKINQLIH